MRATIVGLAAGLLLATTAGPALAGDAACIWNKLPKEKREQVRAAIARDFDEGRKLNPYTQGELNAAFEACSRADPDALAAAGPALGGYELMDGSAQWLEKNLGFNAARLDRAWLEGPGKDPSTPARVFGSERPAAGPLGEAIENMGKALGVPSEGRAGDYVAGYVIGRLLVEYYEPRF